MLTQNAPYRRWTFPGFDRQLGDRPLIMGILNTTPDSFSDGGRFLPVEAAVEQALRLVSEGADILDIGGESTRPNADPVPLEEELRRVVPVIERLRDAIEIPISIDTYKAEVARQALLAGASIVNDISGLRFDAQMLDVCLRHPCGVICMHIQGTPRTMQISPRYENVVEDLCKDFAQRLEELERAGLARERIVIDPGVGFGKTAQHNLEILSNIGRFRQLGRPVLIGHSRKGFLQKILQQKIDERLFGTIGVSIGLAQQHVDLLRVHDVAANRDAIMAWRATQPQGTLPTS
ncbi:dihydropteroate synthase [Schlesneria sp.]|uniref:dihydropteroate synthase n=1 Tax=Schlesneria sp. TaxID=2762018 RepID=UPI002F184D33